MLTSELDYDLPSELIAQHPMEPRDASRLMVIDRQSGTIAHKHFYDLPNYVQAGDLLVANHSQVIPARLIGRKPSGGKAEVLLLRKLDATHWLALVGGRNVKHIAFEQTPNITITVLPAEKDGPERVVQFSQPVEAFLEQLGTMPLPPYIQAQLNDPTRYQTVYASVAGSAAAPTAGLHFTPSLIAKLKAQGVDMAWVTLHVGLDTFKPITEEVVEQHVIHSEWVALPQPTAQAIAQTKAMQRRVLAVGSTSVRVLEAFANGAVTTTPQTAQADESAGFTRFYITPGYQFKTVDAIITNFHLPRSTLLAMMGAFMGLDLLKAAYAEAIRERYRFYSFGDAMLIL
ncbi:MAG: tRNA preQ1(34) S-adenosylmethionine ribosyltransferase-isomerase QueA [Anaerolineae bacterium]|nr:tRNA preQ1(34) S-adenosylmethionine ribosyltransferase-isomerase QueA [Anaerolineae bacterium]